MIQLASFGDCINSTLMIEPIVKAFPDCTLEVHTTTKYESAFRGCPGITRLIAHNANTKDEAFNLYNFVPNHIKNFGNYHKIFNPAPIVNPGEWSSLKHPELGTNLVYSFVRELERHNIPYQLPLKTVLRLTSAEISNAKALIASLQPNRRNILMEVHGESGQTQWKPHWTVSVGSYLVQKPTNLLISRGFDGSDIKQLQSQCPPHSAVRWIGKLSLRECAEVFNHCQAFLSVSSGLSNACNTDHCKTNINWVEVINSPTVSSAPIRSAGKHFFYEDNLARFLSALRTFGV